MNKLLIEVADATKNPGSSLVLHPGELEKICFSCTKKKCSGECKHFEEERRRIKENKSRDLCDPILRYRIARGWNG